MTPAPRPARLRGLLVGALLAVLLPVLVATGPASAHADLASSSPKDGASLEQPPEEVRLTFSEDLLPETVTIVASGPDGTAVPLGAPQVDANVAAVGWPATAPAGAYTVAYRVVSQDGHPVQGTVAFEYGGAGTPTATATGSAAAPTSSPSTRPSATPGAGSTGAAATSATPAPSDGSSRTTLVVVAVVAVLVLVVVAVGVARRRRSSA